MKTRHGFVSVVLPILALICAIFIGTVAQAGSPYRYPRSGHIPPGRLMICRTPNFGWNLAFNLRIDGRPVANVAQGHSYSTWLSAGPHVLTVHKVPAVGFTAPISTTVNIQPGTDHLYIATWNSGLVYLQPGEIALSPGGYWQNHGDGYP